MKIIKEVIGCVKDVVGKKKFLVWLEYGQRRDSFLFNFVCILKIEGLPRGK